MLWLGRQNLAVPYKMSCSYLKAKLSLENLFSKALCVFLLSLFASVSCPLSISNQFLLLSCKRSHFVPPPVLLQLLDILRGPSPQTETSLPILCFLSESGGSQNRVIYSQSILHTVLDQLAQLLLWSPKMQFPLRARLLAGIEDKHIFSCQFWPGF